MKCLHCGKEIPDSIVRAYLNSQAGKAGRGESKRRTSDQARAAVNVRWARHRKAQNEKKDRSL